jgi:hypothetical protein
MLITHYIASRYKKIKSWWNVMRNEECKAIAELVVAFLRRDVNFLCD